MSRVCSVCGKGRMSGNTISHSNRKSRTSWAPNLQKIKVVEGGRISARYVCAKCIKSGKVARA